jgi:hypothetical protein
LLENALEHAGDDRVLRALILGHLALGIAFWRGDPRTAELRANEAVALAEELGDSVVLSENLTTLGQIASLNGRPYAEVMERAVTLAADPTEVSVGTSRAVLGGIRCCSGDLRAARNLLEQELEPATRHGEKRRAFVLLRLAEVDWRAGDLDALATDLRVVETVERPAAPIRTLARQPLVANEPVSFRWDGRSNSGALANPDTYAELTTHRGWSPDHYENWLSDTLTLLLLPPTTGTAGPSK